MPKTCDLCGKELGFWKFRYAEGLICRECYEIASTGCTSTVRQMTRAELEEAYEARKGAVVHDLEFHATQKVGDVLLVDDERKLVCLPHNRRVSGGTKAPDVVAWKDVQAARIVSDPQMSAEELAAFLQRKGSDERIAHLGVEVRVRGRRDALEAVVLDAPVRAKSFAFQQSYGMAIRAMELLGQITDANAKGSKRS